MKEKEWQSDNERLRRLVFSGLNAPLSLNRDQGRQREAKGKAHIKKCA